MTSDDGWRYDEDGELTTTTVDPQTREVVMAFRDGIFIGAFAVAFVLAGVDFVGYPAGWAGVGIAAVMIVGRLVRRYRRR